MMNENFVEEYLHKLTAIHINDLLFYIDKIGQRVHFQTSNMTYSKIICEKMSNSMFHFYEEWDRAGL